MGLQNKVSMRRIKIIADDKIPFLRGVLEKYAEIKYVSGQSVTNEMVADTDALIIRTRTRCDESLLKNSKVKFIATATIGYDHIDTHWCEANGIHWTNAPGCNAASVNQYFLSALAELLIKENLNPAALTLGIVGVGNVGSRVARTAEALGMKVLLNDPPREQLEKGKGFVNLDVLREQSDIISFHVPLSRKGKFSTLKMVDMKFFKQSAKPFFLINTSRGEILDEKSLLTAMEAGMVRQAVLDVWDNEPSLNPDLHSRVFIGTPHIAGYSTDGKANGTRIAVEALVRFFGLKDFPGIEPELPVPAEPVITVDCIGRSTVEIIREVCEQSYPVMQDDSNLRKDPESFEKLRGNYPIRREPLAFSVRLNHCSSPEVPEMLNKLGFNILEESCFC